MDTTQVYKGFPIRGGVSFVHLRTPVRKETLEMGHENGSDLVVVNGSRTQSINAKVSPEEREQFDTLAKKRGVTVSALARDVLISEIQRPGGRARTISELSRQVHEVRQLIATLTEITVGVARLSCRCDDIVKAASEKHAQRVNQW